MLKNVDREETTNRINIKKVNTILAKLVGKKKIPQRIK
jgi:hypothetical protein